MFYLYILYSSTADKYYVGHSENPWARLAQHLNNSGEKYTGSYHDWKLVAVFEVTDQRAHAAALEKFIKKQKSKNLIEKLIDSEFTPQGALAALVRVPHVRD